MLSPQLQFLIKACCWILKYALYFRLFLYHSSILKKKITNNIGLNITAKSAAS